MRVIITGGTGFIGTNLIEALKEYGFDNIVCLTRGVPKTGCSVVKFLNTDYSIKNLSMILESGDIIFHLAGKRLSGTGDDNKVFNFVNVNVEMTENILIAATSVKAKHFITTSTIGVYSNQNVMPYLENCSSIPATTYGLSKLMVEDMVMYYSNKTGLKASILRVAQCYGYGEKDSPVLMKFVKQALNNERITVSNGGKFHLDEVYIEDLTMAMIAVIQKEVEGIFNIGAGIAVSISEIATTVNKVFANTTKIDVMPQKHRVNDTKNNFLNINKAYEMFGWQPKYNLEEGLIDMKKKIIKGNRNENN